MALLATTCATGAGIAVGWLVCALAAQGVGDSVQILNDLWGWR